MATWNPGRSARVSRPQEFRTATFFQEVFFHVMQDGRREKGTTRSLNVQWI